MPEIDDGSGRKWRDTLAQWHAVMLAVTLGDDPRQLPPEYRGMTLEGAALRGKALLDLAAREEELDTSPVFMPSALLEEAQSPPGMW